MRFDRESRAEEVMLYGIGLAIDCAPAPRALPILSSLRPSIGSSIGPFFQGRGGGGGVVVVDAAVARMGRGAAGVGGPVGQGPRLPGGIGIPRLPFPIPQRPPVIPRGPGNGGGTVETARRRSVGKTDPAPGDYSKDRQALRSDAAARSRPARIGDRYRRRLFRTAHRR
jgi:hypothetical protein